MSDAVVARTGTAVRAETAPRRRWSPGGLAGAPSLGRRNEAISLNSVDLPAPFGPITDRISPSRTSKEMSLTATGRRSAW